MNASTRTWCEIPATKSALPQTRELARKAGTTMLALGALSVIVGLIALGNTFAATLATVYVLGSYLIVGGVLNAVDAFTVRKWNLAILDILAAALYFVAAFFIFRQPYAAAATLTFLLASLFMVSGLVRVVGALAMQPAHWGWVMLHGAVTFFLGLLLFFGLPVTGLTGPGLLVGIDLLFSGIASIAFGIAARRAGGAGEARGVSGRGLSPAPI